MTDKADTSTRRILAKYSTLISIAHFPFTTKYYERQNDNTEHLIAPKHPEEDVVNDN